MDMNESEKRVVFGVLVEKKVNAYEVDSRITTMPVLGGARVQVDGERRAAAAKAIADATGGILKRLVDRSCPTV
jgi:hypothetical protein